VDARKIQSALSAAAGSVVDACHAGIQQASSATKTTVAAVPRNRRIAAPHLVELGVQQAGNCQPGAIPGLS
jgi:hypothetical protein